MAGSTSATNIAKWDGNSWSSLGSGVNGTVDVIAVSGSNVYAGGGFTLAASQPSSCIAKWDGQSWAPLGSGLGGLGAPYVTALALSGNDLYAGGQFITAGGKISPYFARAYLLPVPELRILRSDANLTITWPSLDSAVFVLEQADAVEKQTNWNRSMAAVSTDGTNNSVTVPATNKTGFFRLRGP
jgi:hypothetical protein